MPIELEKVRSLFDRPEKTGDSQFMRREVASRMDERLVAGQNRSVLYSGCGMRLFSGYASFGKAF